MKKKALFCWRHSLIFMRVHALQTRLIGFRSNLDPDLTIGYDCSDFDRSNNRAHDQIDLDI